MKKEYATVFQGAQLGTLRTQRDEIIPEPKPGETTVLQNKSERVIERFNGDEWVRVGEGSHLITVYEEPDYGRWGYLTSEMLEVVEDIDTGERYTYTEDLPDEHYLNMFSMAVEANRYGTYIYVTDEGGDTYVVGCIYEEYAKLIHGMFQGAINARDS